ncbi:MAG: UTP--glucose-1-phosphate uridylyltransferase [Clostridia bacterium]|nr:UTP--glucose-1-phosphate uridylyltransferase [Clostridia bacterium]
MLEENARELLKKYGQEHILASYNHLDEAGKEKLTNQIMSIDFQKVKELYEQTKVRPTTGEDKIEPMKYKSAASLSAVEKEKLVELGERVIKENQYAVVMVAGGQGTRLGHNGPKGTFDIGLASHKSLFELFCDQLKKARDTYGVVIPWYIMTSRENNDDTVRFFEEHDYFGYREGVKFFFKQGEFPMVDTEGKLVIGEDYLVKEAADGHGGIFEAMVNNGVLRDMQERGIQWIFTCAVDNPLAHLADPLLVGYAISEQVRVASVSIVKNSPEERVGVFCRRNGRPSVIEYTEISEDMAKAVDENGEFLYGEAHIMMNLFNINVINEIAKEKLPYHSAFKKCNYLSESGEMVVAEKPNAYKFETFIFDAFVRLEDMGILRYQREECFAPVKNAEGSDSPETARKLYEAYYNL